MNRKTLALVPLALGAVLAPASALAAPAQHLTVPETYDATEHFDAGEGSCVPWAGSFHEVRSGEYRLVTAPGGQVPGETHLNGSVDGFVELVPDDPALPTYAGSYREKVGGVLTVVSDDGSGDEARIAHYRLRLPLTGTDGSHLVLTLAGRYVVAATGEVKVATDVMTCR